MSDLPIVPSLDVTDDLNAIPLSSFGAKNDFTPATWNDARALMSVYPGNQGSVPMCAGEMVDMFYRALYWKKTGKKPADNVLNPRVMYDEAKRIDGNRSHGTSFTSVWKAAQNLSMIPETWHLEFWRTVEDCKRAQHRAYTGTCLLGLNITEGWRRINPRNGRIATGGEYDRALGGHAVLAGYYDEDGLHGCQTAWGKIGWASMGFVSYSEDWLKDHLLVGASVWDTVKGIYL